MGETPIYRVSSYPFDDRYWQAKSASAARWRDYKAAREAGYYGEGFAAYVADSPRASRTKYAPSLAGNTEHLPFIPKSALLPAQPKDTP